MDIPGIPSVSAILGKAKDFSPVQWIFVLVSIFFGLWMLWSLIKVLFLPALALLILWVVYRMYLYYKG